MNTLNTYAFEIYVKRSWAPDDKIDATFIQELLDQYNYTVDFPLEDFLKVWQS